MKYIVEYSKKAKKQILALDNKIAKQIALKISDYSKQSEPMRYAKELKGRYKGLYRYRIGSYRVIFSTNHCGEIIIMNILRVKHRRHSYE